MKVLALVIFSVVYLSLANGSSVYRPDYTDIGYGHGLEFGYPMKTGMDNKFTYKLRYESQKGLYSGDKYVAVVDICKSYSEALYADKDVTKGCVSLHITSKDKTGMYPVYVLLPGYDYEYGMDSNYFYDKDVVLVTIQKHMGSDYSMNYNYYDVLGNFGIYDIMQTLQWIQKHISTYGGDVNQVFLIGNDKVVGLIDQLKMIPIAHTLYHDVIYQQQLMDKYTTHGGHYKFLLDVAHEVGCFDVYSVMDLKKCFSYAPKLKLENAYTVIRQKYNGDAAFTYGGIKGFFNFLDSFLYQYHMYPMTSEHSSYMQYPQSYYKDTYNYGKGYYGSQYYGSQYPMNYQKYMNYPLKQYNNFYESKNLPYYGDYMHMDKYSQNYGGLMHKDMPYYYKQGYLGMVGGKSSSTFDDSMSKKVSVAKTLGYPEGTYPTESTMTPNFWMPFAEYGYNKAMDAKDFKYNNFYGKFMTPKTYLGMDSYYPGSPDYFKQPGYLGMVGGKSASTFDDSSMSKKVNVPKPLAYGMQYPEGTYPTDSTTMTPNFWMPFADYGYNKAMDAKDFKYNNFYGKFMTPKGYLGMDSYYPGSPDYYKQPGYLGMVGGKSSTFDDSVKHDKSVSMEYQTYGPMSKKVSMTKKYDTLGYGMQYPAGTNQLDPKMTQNFWMPYAEYGYNKAMDAKDFKYNNYYGKYMTPMTPKGMDSYYPGNNYVY